MAETIRIFMASPGDVHGEREAFAALVREINDTLIFLAPEKGLQLELIRYETHAFPDIGNPQRVINDQIPVDYDILIGVMWRRAGTPTENYDSGTIEEYNRAYRYRQDNASPTIMFYFCEENIPIPSIEEIKQLEIVVKFRHQLEREGYTVTYRRHEDFRETVRGGLLRAIKRIMHERRGEAVESPQPAAETIVPVEARRRLLELANEYNELRSAMPSGDPRTRKMTSLFGAMTALAAQAHPMLAELAASISPGERLAAVAILHLFPKVEYLEWLADRLDPAKEKPFLGFQAAVGLQHAVDDLSKAHCERLRQAVTQALGLAQRLPGDADRIYVLKRTISALEDKCR